MLLHKVEDLPSSGSPKKSGAQNALAMAATMALIKGDVYTRRRSSDPEPTNEWTCRANIAAGFRHFVKFAKHLVDFRQGMHAMITSLMHDPVSGDQTKDTY